MLFLFALSPNYNKSVHIFGSRIEPSMIACGLQRAILWGSWLTGSRLKGECHERVWLPQAAEFAELESWFD